MAFTIKVNGQNDWPFARALEVVGQKWSTADSARSISQESLRLQEIEQGAPSPEDLEHADWWRLGAGDPPGT
jgi:hypothetical protein